MGPNKIAAQILSMNPKDLDQEKIGQLLRIAPEPEEIEVVLAFQGDPTAL